MTYLSEGLGHVTDDEQDVWGGVYSRAPSEGTTCERFDMIIIYYLLLNNI